MLQKIVRKIFWGSVWAAAIFASVYVYYYKFPNVRAKVDEKIPVAKEIHTSIVTTLHLDDTASAAPKEPAQPAASPTPTPGAAAQPAVAPVAELVAQPPPEPANAALTDLPRSEWPKIVSLKKPVEFPAVINGKVVGHVNVPAGTQTHLILIKDGKAGVEFQGGGAMVGIGDTDLAERVQANRRAGVK